MHLYDYLDSGNGYKVRLLLAQLHLPYDWTHVDIDKGGDAHAGFPEAQPQRPHSDAAPRRRHESARSPTPSSGTWRKGHDFVPATRLGRAQVLQWMFFEQYSHEPYVATPRYICRHLPADHPRRAELPARLEKGHAALVVMEGHLSTRSFFVDDRYSIADIALYAYTHVAPDGGLELGAYPRVREWLARVAAQADHVKLLDVPGKGVAA